MQSAVAGRRLQTKISIQEQTHTAWIPAPLIYSLSLYDWAKFRSTKGAVKVHMLLDHDGYLPSFAVITMEKPATSKPLDVSI